MNNQATFNSSAWYGEVSTSALVVFWRCRGLPIVGLGHRKQNARRVSHLFAAARVWADCFEPDYTAFFDYAAFRPSPEEAVAFERTREFLDDLFEEWSWTSLLAARRLVDPLSLESIMRSHYMLMGTRPFIRKRHLKTMLRVVPKLMSLSRHDDRGGRMFTPAKIAYFRSGPSWARNHHHFKGISYEHAVA
jgi:hypothetical protein